MAEYYAVLKKAVSGMDAGAGDARRAVYDKARNALIGQLKAIDPPLSTSEISRQRLELEEAIRRVEREVAAETQSVRGRAAESVREAIESSGPSPQDVFRRAIQDAEGRASAPVERAPVPARADSAYGSDGRNMRDRVERSPPMDAPSYRDEPTPRARNPQPQLAPDYDYDWQQEPPRRSAPELAPYAARGDRPRQGGRGRGYVDQDERELLRGGRRSRLPAILLTVLIIGMLVALAALGFSQKDLLAELFRGVGSGTTQQTADAPPAADENAASNKDNDRLGDVAAGDEPVRQVEPAEPSGQPAGEGAPGVVLAGQKATLYEEPTAAQAAASGGVTAIKAQATWRFTNGNDGPEVVATIEVPERKMKVRVSIRKNTDATLPASHLVEVVVDTPPDFPGRGIRSVPRLVMKQAEDARGQPLVGASAKVADGFFWIALSAADTDVGNNLKTLREGGWLDLPIIYESGQRAILTFEKGAPGQQAFDTALTTWGG